MKNVSHLALAAVFSIATVLLLVFGVARADTLDAGGTGSAIRVPAFDPAGVVAAPSVQTPSSAQPSVVDAPAAPDVSAVQKLWRSGALLGAGIVALYLLLTQLGKLDPKHALYWVGGATALSTIVDTTLGTGVSPNLSMLIMAGVSFVGIIARGPAKAASTAAFALLFVGVATSASLSTGCKPYAPPAPLKPVVDCINADRGKVVSLIDTLWPFGGPIDWSVVEAQAMSAGVEIGGCALAEFVQMYLAPPRGTAVPPPEQANAARDTLDHFRNTKANGATFKTSYGAL